MLALCLTVAGLCKVVHPCDLVTQICRKLSQEGHSLGYTVRLGSHSLCLNKASNAPLKGSSEHCWVPSIHIRQVTNQTTAGGSHESRATDTRQKELVVETIAPRPGADS